ncbi:tripartite tricarboxylate transporter permease [Paenibacillus rhizophilus]|uniref:Tat pathway signal protein n=1 Tax=Paenibacillus rhizophilus TaxID=1850366 RepID=A0A3N9P6Z3_9BACL|nr:tripartite tricarboxylate transporter permease [Paenibacillus rhizophilus]RQW10844.1 Tat pathway signal protein [Paenibacillus rhizophilus]
MDYVHVLQAFYEVLKLVNLFYLFIGTLAGIIAGTIPGLTFTTAIILALPFTFGMDPISGLTLMIGIYTGGASGGLVTSTLIGIPGTPSAVTTMFDGHPMSQKGESGRALGLGIIASVFGTIFGAIILFFFGPLVAKISLKFGPWEVFSLMVFALTLIAGLSGASLLKGLIAGLFGLLIATIGYDPNGQLRFDFGMDSLASGIAPLPALMGLFGLSTLLKNIEELRNPISKPKTKANIRIPMLQVCKDMIREKFVVVQSSIIGVLIGALPAAGAETAAFIAYDQAKKFAKDKEKYGTGHPGGIIASEASNNANAGGSFIPSITLGIPGDMASAVMLGVLIMHGITPGPGLFQAQPVLAQSIFVALLLSAFMLLITQTALLPLLVRISYIPMAVLVPSIIVFSCLGAFALNNQMVDVWMVVIFGLIGYVLDKIDVPIGPIILGLLLGPKAEEELMKALQINSEITPFFAHPISLIFLLLTVSSIVLTIWKNRKSKTITKAE